MTCEHIIRNQREVHVNRKRKMWYGRGEENKVDEF